MTALRRLPMRTDRVGSIRGQEWTTHSWPCLRCGVRVQVKWRNPEHICRDCQAADPDYVKMIRAQEEPCPV